MLLYNILNFFNIIKLLNNIKINNNRKTPISILLFRIKAMITPIIYVVDKLIGF